MMKYLIFYPNCVMFSMLGFFSFQFSMVWPQAVVLVLFCILQNLGPVTPTSDGDAYFLKETEVIPRNEREYRMLTKDLNCEGNNLNVSYVLHSTEMKTLMVCTPDKTIYGKWCPEFNPVKLYSQNGIVQPKFTAECANMSVAPCKGIYSVLESYLFFECFQRFGGISSPMESSQKLKLCKERYENSSQVVAEKENIISEKQKDVEAHKNTSKIYVGMLKECEERYENLLSENTLKETVMLVIMLTITAAIVGLFLYNFVFLYLTKRFFYKENITYKNYIVSRKILLINFFTIRYSVSDVIGTAENNTSHSETTTIIIDKGKEKDEEQHVNVDVRETDNQHPHPDEHELRRLTVDLPEDDRKQKVWY